MVHYPYICHVNDRLLPVYSTDCGSVQHTFNTVAFALTAILRHDCLDGYSCVVAHDRLLPSEIQERCSALHAAKGQNSFAYNPFSIYLVLFLM
jgi:hypothetical protein